MKGIQTGSKILGLMMMALLLLGSVQFLSAKERELYKTGLPELTEEELQWQNKHMLKVKKVKLNKLGLDRINKLREKKGKGKINKKEAKVVGIGSELEVTTGAEDSIDTDSELPLADYPGFVDNSQLKYFPPIRTQGSLNSCGAFSATYYTMTHMHGLANDLDVKNSNDALCLSPKWTYNMLNGGGNNGTWYYQAYEIGQKHGVATWTEFPYDSDYRAWSLNPDTWEDALYRRFDQYGYVTNTHTDSGIEQVKQMLLNGYVLNIPTYINSWKWQTIGDDPSTDEDDTFTGKKCATWVNGTAGYHAMTVVGYNDHIWVDINGNNIVDTGEKGAFRIANSWGTGWGEAGFAWMSYDALKNPSAVSGGPSANRIYGWSPSRAHWVTAKAGYTPRLIGKFTLRHAKRDHLRMTLGVSDINQSTPATLWTPEMIYNQGGAYAFNGTTTAVDGTFVFDFTDILPSGGGINTWYVGVRDDTAGSEAQIGSFTLIDLTNGYQEVQSIEVPQTADGSLVYVTVDYDYFEGNFQPTAEASASALSGQANIEIQFYGDLSYDSDGSIVSYEWDFGDGASQTGANVDHIYGTPGMYTATLRVTDNGGAADTESIMIEILPDPSRIVYVSDLQAVIIPDETAIRAKIQVEVLDISQNPVPGALVQGHWSDLLTGETSCTTSVNGIADCISGETQESGIITFIIDDVSASGYGFDPSLNAVSSISISTDGSVNGNQDPVPDLATFAVQFGQTGCAACDADLDGDGDVDGKDLILFINQ